MRTKGRNIKNSTRIMGDSTEKTYKEKKVDLGNRSDNGNDIVAILRLFIY